MGDKGLSINNVNLILAISNKIKTCLIEPNSDEAEKKDSGHPSHESHEIDNEKIDHKISRRKTNTWDTKYVELNGAKDTVEEKLFTYRNKLFDIHMRKFEENFTLNPKSKTAKISRESVRKSLEKRSSYFQDEMGVNGNNRSLQKPSIKSLISVYDPLQHNNNHAGIKCFEPETSDKLQSKTETNNKTSEIN